MSTRLSSQRLSTRSVFPTLLWRSRKNLTGLPIVGMATDTGLWRRRNATERLRTGPKITVCELRSSNLRFTQLLLSSLPQQFAEAPRKGYAERAHMEGNDGGGEREKMAADSQIWAA